MTMTSGDMNGRGSIVERERNGKGYLETFHAFEGRK